MKTPTPQKKTPAKMPRIAVTESNIRKAAKHVLPTALVSTEIQYLQHKLGNSATLADIEAGVVAVRAMPWASIVLPD